jgi:hypothetical protein
LSIPGLLIERRWIAREYKRDDDTISQYLWNTVSSFSRPSAIRSSEHGSRGPSAKLLRWRLVATEHVPSFDRYNITSDDDLREAVKQTVSHLAAQATDRKVVSMRK